MRRLTWIGISAFAAMVMMGEQGCGDTGGTPGGGGGSAGGTGGTGGTGNQSGGNDADVIQRDVGPRSSADIAMNPDGSAVAVWSQTGPPLPDIPNSAARDDIWSSRYTPSGGWGAAELVEFSDTSYAYRPAVVMDPEGNVIAIWTSQAGTAETIRLWANRYTRSDGWGTPEVISANTEERSDSPEIAMDENGNALVVWNRWRTIDGKQHHDNWANRYTPAGGWGAPERLGGGVPGPLVDTANGPRLAMDAMGNAVVLWLEIFEPEGGGDFGSDLWTTSYAPGAGWDTAELLALDTPTDVSVAMVNGRALAVHLDGVGYHYTVADGWGPPEQVGQIATQVGLADDGSAIIVAPTPEGGLANRYTPTDGWGAPEEMNSEVQGRLGLAMAPNGTAFIAWASRDAETQRLTQVWARRYTPSDGWGTAKLMEGPDGFIRRESPFSPGVQTDSEGNAAIIWWTKAIEVAEGELRDDLEARRETSF